MDLLNQHKTAIVFGATGLVGGYLLQHLLVNHTYHRILAFTRRPLPFDHEKLQVHVIDFDQPQQWQQLLKGDDLFCCLGTTIAKAGSQEAFYKVDFEYAFQSAKIGATNGVNQFLLVSSVGAKADSLFFYSRVKGELEDAVKKLDFWSLHIFQPSVLLGTRNENRFGEQVAAKLGSVIDRVTGGLLMKYRPVEAETVAKAMITAAQKLKPGTFIYPSHWLQKMSIP